jgi:hypothetical protein
MSDFCTMGETQHRTDCPVLGLLGEGKVIYQRTSELVRGKINFLLDYRTIRFKKI